MQWTCPGCQRVYEVPPGKAIECLCSWGEDFGKIVLAPLGAKASDPYPGVTFKDGVPPPTYRSPVNPT